MRRAVVDQPGFRITFIGLVLGLFLGLALRSQISDIRIQQLLNKSVERLQNEFVIDYGQARINLSKWSLPFPVLDVSRIRLSPKGQDCQNSQIYIEELEVPISFSAIFGLSTKVPKIRLSNVELRLGDADKCLQNNAHEKKENNAKADAVKEVKDSPKTTGQLKDVFEHNTKAELSEIYIDKLKIILSKTPEQPILLRQVNVDLQYNENKLAGLVIKSKINAIKDAKSDIYYINANLNFVSKRKGSDAIENIINVEGKLLDGDVQLLAHYVTSEPKVSYEVSVDKVSAKALLPVLSLAPPIRSIFSEKIPISLSLKNSGEVLLNKNNRLESSFKKLILNIDNAQIKSNEIAFSVEDGKTTVQPFDFLIDGLPLSKIKNIDLLRGKLDSFESLGIVSGKLSYVNENSFKFDGLLRGLEVVFSNRGRRDLQIIEEMNFHFKKNQDVLNLEANSLVIGGHKIDGVLTINHETLKNHTKANLKVTGPLFNKKVWEQFTFVEQSPVVDVTWNYNKAENEDYNLKIHADNLELPGILFGNLNIDLQQSASLAEKSKNIIMNIRPAKVTTSDKFLENEYISQLLNQSVGVKGQLYTSDKMSIQLEGSSWKNLKFSMDTILNDITSKIPMHVQLKGSTIYRVGVESKLNLSVKGQTYKFEMNSAGSDPLVIQALQ